MRLRLSIQLSEKSMWDDLGDSANSKMGRYSPVFTGDTGFGVALSLVNGTMRAIQSSKEILDEVQQ